MSTLLSKIEASDIAAYLIIVGCIILLLTGQDGEVKSLLAVAGGWAFRKPAINGVAKIVRKPKKPLGGL